MKPSVLAVPHLSDRMMTELSRRFDVFGPMERSTADAVPAGASEARALLTIGGLTTDAALIAALPKLELIVCYGTGYEGVDRAAAAARGITVANAGDANADSVAEYAITLALASARRVTAADRFVRGGHWKGNAVNRMPSVPGLFGKRMGVYGLGAVGQRVATIAQAFRMEVGYHNRNRRADVPHAYFDSLVGLAEWADILVVAVRASADNRGAVNRDVLAALGPEGHVVNISRGIAIDEDALCDAIEQEKIAGAGLDVFIGEPAVSERILKLDRIVVGPHIAAGTQLAQRAQEDRALENLDAFFAGNPVVSLVAL